MAWVMYMGPDKILRDQLGMSFTGRSTMIKCMVLPMADLTGAGASGPDNSMFSADLAYEAKKL